MYVGLLNEAYEISHKVRDDRIVWIQIARGGNNIEWI